MHYIAPLIITTTVAISSILIKFRFTTSVVSDMADTATIDVTKAAESQSSSSTTSVRRRMAMTRSNNVSSTSRATTQNSASMSDVDRDAAEERRKATRNLQLRNLSMATKMAGLTFLIGMWLLGFFSSGDWPEKVNVHAVSLPSRQYDALQANVREGAPFMVAFYSAKCMACRRMQSPFLQAGQRLEGVLPFYSVSAVQPGVRDLLKQYDVKLVPSVIFVNGNGVRVPYVDRAEAHHIVGFVKRQQIVRQEEAPQVEKSESVSDSSSGDGGSMK